MDCSSLSDQQIIAESLKSSDVFRCLVERFEPRLRRFLQRLSGLSPSEVDELMQETYIKVFRHLAAYDPNLQLENWLYRIARNTYIDSFRHNRNRRSELSIDAQAGESANLLVWLGTEAKAEKKAMQDEMLECIGRIIADLPDSMREVAILKLLEDKSYQEMGDILRKPKGTIASLVNRARQEILKRYRLEVGNA